MEMKSKLLNARLELIELLWILCKKRTSINCRRRVVGGFCSVENGLKRSLFFGDLSFLFRMINDGFGGIKIHSIKSGRDTSAYGHVLTLSSFLTLIKIYVNCMYANQALERSAEGEKSPHSSRACLAVNNCRFENSHMRWGVHAVTSFKLKSLVKRWRIAQVQSINCFASRQASCDISSVCVCWNSTSFTLACFSIAPCCKLQLSSTTIFVFKTIHTNHGF